MTHIWGTLCGILTSQVRDADSFVSLALWWGDKKIQKKDSAADK